jgi:hypothetical protein
VRVPGYLRSALRTGARTGAGRTLPAAVLLVVLVVLAAGISGTSHFAGARWLPRVRSGTGVQTGTIVVPTTTLVGGAGRPHSHAGGLPSWLGITVLVLIALALIVLGWRWWSGRRLPSAPDLHGASVQATQTIVQPEPEPEPEKLLTGIELALVALDEEREPADAVVRAWLGLQETAEESGIVRRPSETPTEFTSRILSGAFADDRALRTLLRLYLRTRFGDHPVIAEDVAEVREALRRLVSSWQAAGGAPTTGAR